jgi:hypothetical protein
VLTRLVTETIRPEFQVFFYLQVLDFLTTLVGFRIGLVEASPFVNRMVAINPTLGVAASKAIAFALAALCVRLDRARVVRWINYWYAALVVWNLCFILVGTARLAR